MIVAIVLVVASICFFIWKHRYVNKLREVRDNFDFTTPEGRWLIQIYNRKIDQLNGKRLFKNA